MALAKNKLNIIETLLVNALNDFEISHEEFSKIIDEKNKYEGIKENIKNIHSKELDTIVKNTSYGLRSKELDTVVGFSHTDLNEKNKTNL